MYTKNDTVKKTGGANFHGVHEFIPVNSMEKMVEVLVNLMKGNK